MLRNIFLPEKIGSYYLFAQRILACEITKSHVRMTVVLFDGNKKIIERFVEKALDSNNNNNSSGLSVHDKVVDVLSSLSSLIRTCDKIYLVLPSNLVVFKELTLPFVDLEKIKLVLPFEVESFLPFSLQDATVDCVITSVKEKTSEKISDVQVNQSKHSESTVLVAAIKNDVLNEHLSMFKSAGVLLDRVTVDFFELYGLYQVLGFADTQKNTVALYIGLYTTRIELLVDGKLRAVRFLSQGLVKFAKYAGLDIDELLKVGVSEAQNNSQFLKLIEPFFFDIKLTLDASREKLSIGQKWDHIILSGLITDIKNIDIVIEKIMSIECKAVCLHDLIQQGKVVMKNQNSLPKNSTITLSSALNFSFSENFNFNKLQQASREAKTLLIQFITAGSFLVLVFLFLFGYHAYRARMFNAEIKSSEQETVELLKKEFPLLAKRVRGNSLDMVARAAKAELDREKSIWFALSPQNRASVLKYLQELSTRLDPDGLGFVPTRLTITGDVLLIEGSVRDYEALNKFEEDLRQSPLFLSIPRLEELKFSARITLNKNIGDRS